MIGKFPEVLNFNRLFLGLNWFITSYATSRRFSPNLGLYQPPFYFESFKKAKLVTIIRVTKLHVDDTSDIKIFIQHGHIHFKTNGLI